MRSLLVFFCLFFATQASSIEEEDRRFIFYDVNPGEGFNLRRDVFVRMAVMVKKLNEMSKKFHYTLVLPPWGPLYHWQSRSLGEQSRIAWKQFFDLDSIVKYVPIMDFEDYLKLHAGDVILDMVYYLQNYKEGWKSGEFREKMDASECLNAIPYHEEDDLLIYGPFWQYYGQVRANDISCISVQGTTRIMREFIEEQSPFKTVMLDRAEQLLHEYFGDEEYWSARRSMRFAGHLIAIADDFREAELKSNDVKDNTIVPNDWTSHEPIRGSAKGGPYVCAHIRRKDYVHSRKGQIPDLAGAAEQLVRKCQEFGVDTVFVATDAPKGEVDQLRQHFSNKVKLVKFEPSSSQLNMYKDGGVAILDQIICSHAQYFMGSAESTFTFRIQEEREIMGFSVDKTFDMLCPNSGQFNCSKGSIWKIVYPSNSKRNLHSEL